MEQPQGFATVEGNICRLRLSLYALKYALKQALRIWYQTLVESLETLDFRRISADDSVFTWGIHYVAMYVDDLLIFGPERQGIDSLKNGLKKRFKISDLEACRYYLGLEISRNEPYGPLRVN